ncbi:AAA family ATPase [Enterococcus alcedinis]|uniref:Magnesium chelatase n=1 Tax=Enterococcus alcedinis TaxID=1274384 RepID=A0A917JEV6_9ENTE|nr:MoxR family ATPase [Enterococcus alcedinis]MBP2101006.1 MoxR-like ATPase [Enterococcus alcedinis]GGI64695.1 magnesium chelatase [Enterococcus alcedinis]
MSEENLASITRLIDEVEKVILGKRQVIQLTVTALLAGGHVLFEDVPGVGKTMLVKALSEAIHGRFSRIQFTPDLLPSDILGVSILNRQTNAFEFRKGPVFTDFLLADEINRTTPRTQAALLEAMSENSVTVDGQTFHLAEHFFVLATQNPIEYEGTYPLPEAQLDRFLFKLAIGYPSEEDELRLMTGKRSTPNIVSQVMNENEIIRLKEQVDRVYIDDIVAKYALALVQKSRTHPEVELGISPRGSMALIRGAKAFAMTEGRMFVTPKDFQILLPAVFSHRLQLKYGRVVNKRGDEILNEILESVPVPVRR